MKERFSCQAEIKVNDWFRLRLMSGAAIPSVSLHEGLPSAHRLERRQIGATRPFSFRWTAFFVCLSLGALPQAVRCRVGLQRRTSGAKVAVALSKCCMTPEIGSDLRFMQSATAATDETRAAMERNEAATSEQADAEDAVGRTREPAFNLPSGLTAILFFLIAIHALRTYVLSAEVDQELILNFAFLPARYTIPFSEQGLAWLWTPVTYSFLHGSWEHLIFNIFWMVAFGAPVVRRIGVARLALFWCLSAAAAVGLHVLFHWGEMIVVVGASGVVSGFMGAAARFVFHQAAVSAANSPTSIDGFRSAKRSPTAPCSSSPQSGSSPISWWRSACSPWRRGKHSLGGAHRRLPVRLLPVRAFRPAAVKGWR